MKTKFFFLLAIIVSLVILVGCGVPDIDEYEQAGSQSLSTLYLHPPRAPLEPGAISGQRYLTTIASAGITGDGSAVYDLPLAGGAASELVAILNVETTLTSRNFVLDSTATSYKTLFFDNNYHVNVRRIVSRAGPTARVEFYDNIQNLDSVTVTYEYSTHYDADAGNAVYDPQFTPYEPVLLYWEAPLAQTDAGDAEGAVLGYRIYRNYNDAVSPRGNDFQMLNDFDNKTFAASTAADVDTGIKAWVHTNDIEGSDTSLTQLTADRQFWEDVYTYYVVTVDEFGNTSRWSEMITARTVPPTAFPEIDDVSSLVSSTKVKLYWKYPHKQYNETDQLESFAIYRTRDPGTSVADTKSIVENATIMGIYVPGNNDIFNIDAETYVTSDFTATIWFYYDTAGHKIGRPDFYWVEAIDKWTNVSRRSSLYYNNAGY